MAFHIINYCMFAWPSIAHFFAVAFLCFMSVAAIPGIIEEKAVFDREVMNAAYSVDAYVISNTLTSLPFIALIGAIL